MENEILWQEFQEQRQHLRCLLEDETQKNPSGISDGKEQTPKDTLSFVEDLILCSDENAARIRIGKGLKEATVLLKLVDAISDFSAEKINVSLSIGKNQNPTMFFVLCSLAYDFLHEALRQGGQ